MTEVTYSSIEFYNQLKSKFKDYLKPGIISVSMVQDEGAVFLEIAESEILSDGLEKISVRRTNLDFITDSEEDQSAIYLYFDPNDKIENNVRKFMNDFGIYSIVMTTELFHKEACDSITKKYNIFGIVN